MCRSYEFKVAKLASNKRVGHYSDLMIDVCETYGMKPICDNPTYCATDKSSLYFGHQGYASELCMCSLLSVLDLIKYIRLSTVDRQP